MIPNDGTYRAKLNGPIVIYFTEDGALCAAIPVSFPVGEDGSWSGKHTATLVKTNGEVQTKTLENLHKVFGWPADDANPYWLVDNDLSAVEFDVVGGPEDYTPQDGPTREVFKIRWLNPPGQGGVRMPEAADRQAVMNKFGAQFRALAAAPKSTPKPAPAKETKPAPPKPAGEKKSAPPSEAPISTMEKAWQTLVDKNADKNEAELGDLWYATIREMFPGKANSDITPQEWGRIQAEFNK